MSLEEILVSDHVNDYQKQILEFIPELKPCVDFQQRHPHHHLDVWDHTMLGISLAPKDFEIRLVLLLHDIGKPFSYQVDGEVYHYKGHAQKSREMAEPILRRFFHSEEFIQEVLYLIEEHDTELTPEEVIRDYDLSYKKYMVQKCDALAHHPTKLEKRKRYLERTKEYFKK